MHKAERVREALALAAAGSTTSEIARLTGIPRGTVKDWVAGKLPSSLRNVGASCPACGHPAHCPDELPAEYVYLRGLYLGDGCISTHRRGVHRLRIVLDGRYPGIIDECANAMALVMPRNRVSRQQRTGNFATSSPHSHTEVHAYSKSWPCLFPQHGPGKKHERAIVLTDWQERLIDRDPRPLLRGLIHSDGCRFINTGRSWRHPRYVFNNYSDDIRRIFREACDRLGLHWTEAPHTVYVSRVADVAVLDSFIGPKA
jgi:hypothetical protein